MSNKIVRKKIGRNDPCYCGSAKKYKNCCIFTKPTPAVSTTSEILKVPGFEHFFAKKY